MAIRAIKKAKTLTKKTTKPKKQVVQKAKATKRILNVVCEPEVEYKVRMGLS